MDALKALDDLKAAGIAEGPARVMIRLVTDAVELQAATKTDLAREAASLQAGMATLGDGLRREMAGLRDELRRDLAEWRDETNRGMAALRLDVLREFAAVRDSLNTRLLTTVRLHFGGTALLLGGFYALLR